MRSALFLILAFCCSFARADLSKIQFLNEVGTNSNLYAASMMVYYNPKDRTPDERSLAAAFQALVLVQAKVNDLSNPPVLLTPYEEMFKILTQLENTKRSESAIFPANILRVLQLNKEIQVAVEQAYKAELAQTPSPVAQINTQSADIARLLMDYQLRRYPLDEEAKAPFRLDPATLPELDKQIEANFIQLLQQFPANADYLEPAFKNYRFVRKQLLQSKGRPNGGAEFYITRTVIDLNDLGVTILAEQQTQEAGEPQTN